MRHGGAPSIGPQGPKHRLPLYTATQATNSQHRLHLKHEAGGSNIADMPKLYEKLKKNAYFEIFSKT